MKVIIDYLYKVLNNKNVMKNLLVLYSYSTGGEFNMLKVTVWNEFVQENETDRMESVAAIMSRASEWYS